jgi:hypothetical protein
MYSHKKSISSIFDILNEYVVVRQIFLMPSLPLQKKLPRSSSVTRGAGLELVSPLGLGGRDAPTGHRGTRRATPCLAPGAPGDSLPPPGFLLAPCFNHFVITKLPGETLLAVELAKLLCHLLYVLP